MSADHGRILSSLVTLLVLVVSISVVGPAYGQEFQVRGTVTSGTDGMPLPGASIVEEGTTTGTSTNAQGQYTLEVSGPNTRIVVSFIGFLSQTIDVNGREVIDVVLEEDVGQLEEVVVTAFGIERQQRALGYSVSKVSGESLREAREPNIANALAGKIAGVVVSKPATGPSGSSRVVIRGNNSLQGSNQPLYVVDGIPIDNSTTGQAGMWGGVDEGDGISGINPDDIENISVLKGPAAAALYGTRAQNGVILITTKTGRGYSNTLGIEYNSNLTFEDALVGYHDYQTEYGQGTQGRKPTTLDEALATGAQSWGARLDGEPVIQFDGEMRPYSLVDNKLDRFYETGLQATNSIALTGGIGGTTFRASASYLDAKGIVESAGMERYNVSLRGTSQFGEKLSSDVRISYVHEDVDNRTRLSDSPGNPNYTIAVLPTNVDPQVLAPGNRPNNELAELQFSTNVFATNPYWAARRFIATDKEHRFMGFGLLRYEFLPWLSLQGRVGQDWYNTRLTNIVPYGTAFEPAGSMNERDVTVMERNWDFLFAANRPLSSDIGLSATVGGNRMDRTFELLQVSGNTFNIPTLYTITNLANSSGNYGYSAKRINSLYGSAEFSFRDYAFLTVTARNDWSSTLPSDNNSYFYPSVSGSFVFSDAFTMPSWMTFGKLRASWAEVGGDTEPYQLSLTYAMMPFTHNGRPLGYVGQNSIPLASLKPSSSVGVEAGFEVRFLNNRVGLDFTWYDESSTNQILSTTVVESSGFGAKVINAGEMRNTGVEALLNLTPVLTGDIRWDLDFNLGLNRNEVVELTEGLDQLGLDQARSQTVSIVAEVGEPYSTIKGTTYVRDSEGNIVLDAAGLPVQGPREVLGVGTPDWTGGIMNTFRYKNVTLSALIDISWGGEIYAGTNQIAYGAGLHKNTLAGRDVCEEVGWENPCWVPPGVVNPPTNEAGEIVGPGTPNTTAVYPQSYWGAVASRIAEEFVYDASYIKLRELQLRFRVPNSWLGRSPIQLAQVSLVGRNLWLIHSKVPNVDPESTYNNTNAQGLEWAGVPQTRSIGFNLNFRL